MKRILILITAVALAFGNGVEVWMPKKIDGEIERYYKNAFRKKFPTAKNCRNGYENVGNPWNYSDENIVIERAFSSKEGNHLVEMKLSPYRCDGPPTGTLFQTQNLYFEKGEAKLIGTAMRFLKSLDKEGDGKSEFLFSVEDYNKHGYILFSNDMKDSVRTTWSDH